LQAATSRANDDASTGCAFRGSVSRQNWNASTSSPVASHQFRPVVSKKFSHTPSEYA
jgi:hypothetical protein